jgi:hypothetical protein
MELSEAILRKAFVEALSLLRAVDVRRLESYIGAGMPDIIINGRGGMWVETKLADPWFKSKGIQRLTLSQLGKVCPAVMVIWDMSTSSTMIVTSGNIPVRGPGRINCHTLAPYAVITGDLFPFHTETVEYLERLLLP